MPHGPIFVTSQSKSDHISFLALLESTISCACLQVQTLQFKASTSSKLEFTCNSNVADGAAVIEITSDV